MLGDLFIATILVSWVIGIYLYKPEQSKAICENKLDSLIITKGINSAYWQVTKGVPLSVRQNNPINIKRYKVNKWQGSIYKQGIFEHFSTPEMGIRASLKVINSNILVTDSVESFVKRIVTKEGKNNLFKYIEHLELKLGYKGVIKKADSVKVLKAMIFLEGGTVAVEYYTQYLGCR